MKLYPFPPKLILLQCSLVIISCMTFPVLANPQLDPIIPITVTLYVGGNGPNNYTFIQEAIDAADEGYIIYVYNDSSPYKEHLFIDKPLQIIGEHQDSTVIAGTLENHVIEIQSNDVDIQGFTIVNPNSTWNIAGIHYDHASMIKLTNVQILDFKGYGIQIKPDTCNTIVIDNCQFSNNNFAIYHKKSNNNTISNSTFLNNYVGVYLVEVKVTDIMDNHFEKNSVGIQIERSTHLKIKNNFFVKNDDGMYLFFSSECDIKFNSINENRWFGLWLINSSFISIQFNQFNSNIDIGLYLESSENNLVRDNVFYGNDDGIYLEYSEDNSIIYNGFNNLKFNAYFVATNLKHLRNSFCFNFWIRSRIMPYIIPGKIKLDQFHLPWFIIDWKPLRHSINTQNMTSVIYNDTHYVGGSGPGNFSTIQDAVNASENGDTIFVYPGTYSEKIIIDKEIRLIGEHRDTVILDGEGRKDILLLTADKIQIQRFTIANGHYGIRVENTKKHIIKENYLTESLHAISIYNGQNIIITQNIFENNPYGIRLFYCMDVMTTNNSFTSYKLNAFFIGSSLGECKHTWQNNNWEGSSKFPVPILGKYQGKKISFFIVNFDWIPK